MGNDHFAVIQEQTRFRGFLIFEGIFCLVAAVFAGLKSETLTSIIGFPLQPLALAMQRLSLSGEPGNSIAWVMYIGLSLLPAVVFILLHIRKKNSPADLLLLLLSAALFYCYELLINPGMITTAMTVEDGTFALACGIVTDLIFLLWLVLRWTVSVKRADHYDFTKSLTYLIRLFRIILVFEICYSSISSLISSLETMTSGNSVWNSFGDEVFASLVIGIDMSSYYTTIAISVLSTVVNVIPNIFALLILSGLEKLFLQMKEAPFSESSIRLSEMISHRCLNYLIIGIALEAAFNLIQLLLFNKLLAAYFTLTLPIIPLIILVIAWIFSDYVRKGKALQDDNDSFI